MKNHNFYPSAFYTPSLKDVLGLFLACGILYFLASSIYLLHIHPLARFPGPKARILSRFPNSRSLRNGTFIHALKTIHDQYGPIVRYSANELSFIDPQAWQDIYGHHGGEQNFPRNPLWYQRAPNGAHTILSADNADHARVRRLLSHAFSQRALKEQEYLLQIHFDRLIDKLCTQADGRPINIVDWFHFVTFDIAGELEFGESFGCVENRRYHPWISVMLSHFKRLVILGSFVMAIPILRPVVPFLIPKKIQEQRMQRFEFAKHKVDKRLDIGDDPQRADFMTYVCRYNDEKGMSREEIYATFEILVSASSETTATALTGILHYLIRYPKQFAKLRTEIRAAFKRNEDITIDGTAKLQYLTAVIQEGLRLCPPTPTMLPRLVPKGGASICGEWLPGGTSVGVPQWSMFRSASNFSSPDEFIPERWQTPLAPPSTGSPSSSSPPNHCDSTRDSSSLSRPAVTTHNLKAFEPFSTGPRNCLGKGVAWAELRIILSKLIWRFEIESAGELGMDYDWKEQLAFIMWEKQPLKVALREVRR